MKLPSVNGVNQSGITSDARAGVIFDMDGVLVDSGNAHTQAWLALGDRIGARVDRARLDQTFGMHGRDIVAACFGADRPEAECARLADLKEQIYRDLAPTYVRPMPGASDLIRALHKADFALAIGSSGPRANIELVLGLLGVAKVLRVFITGEEVHRGKPDPEVFLKAIAKLGLPAARCVVIEDAPQGVEAAHRAGAKAVALASSRPRQELGAAELVIDSLAELDSERLRALLG